LFYSILRAPRSTLFPYTTLFRSVAGAVCFLAIQLKFRFGYDDALDVIGVHLVGGIAGSLLLGLFADKAVNPDFGANGLLFGGGRSEEHTSELQSRGHLVCRLLLE